MWLMLNEIRNKYFKLKERSVQVGVINELTNFQQTMFYNKISSSSNYGPWTPSSGPYKDLFGIIEKNLSNFY